MNLVYVLQPDRKPLMPCVPAVARLLLKRGKAKVRSRMPFVIQLAQTPNTTYTQPLTLGMDTGRSVVGTAVADVNGAILYASEVTLRTDIATTMIERAAKRRNRRQRKTRYRQPRWQNRKNSIRTERFLPTMHSKIEGHLRETRFVQSILPISQIILETGTFDPHALKNPEVLQKKWLYQRGHFGVMDIFAVRLEMPVKRLFVSILKVKGKKEARLSSTRSSASWMRAALV